MNVKVDNRGKYFLLLLLPGGVIFLLRRGIIKLSGDRIEQSEKLISVLFQRALLLNEHKPEFELGFCHFVPFETMTAQSYPKSNGIAMMLPLYVIGNKYQQNDGLIFFFFLRSA